MTTHSFDLHTPVLVIGGGALGSYFAAMFAQAGHTVHLTARSARLAGLQAQGVRLRLDGQPVRAFSVPVSQNPPVGFGAGASSGGCVVILAVKAPELPDVIDQIQRTGLASPTFLTVQNGVEAADAVAAAFPEAAVLASRVHGFFELAGDGTVLHRGVTPSLALGPVAGDAAHATAVAGLLNGAGIAATVAHDIRADLWRKFLLAAPLGTVGSALGADVGTLRRDPAAWDILKAAMQEIVDLGAACGIALPVSAIEDTLSFIATFPDQATTSLQRDLLAGRAGEFDALTGAVLRLGQQYAVPVPVHAGLAHRIASDRPGLIAFP